MKHKRIIGWMVLVVGIVLLVGGAAYAATEAYDLTWWTSDGGGGTSSGGSYSVSGTIGQADAGTALTGGSYRLDGGFWGGTLGGGGADQYIYLPLVRR